MPLYTEAYLTIDDGESEGVFQLKLNLEESAELVKRFIMSSRGQYLEEAYEQLPIDIGDDPIGTRRRGYTLDGGAGEMSHTVGFQTGLEDVQWGDGSGGTGPENTTIRDASGEGVHPLTRKQVLEEWIARARTDSGGQARFYFGEWSTGRFADSAGVFNEPMFVAVREHNLSAPELEQDINSMEGTITLERVALFPDAIPDDVNDAIDLVRDALDSITDF